MLSAMNFHPYGATAAARRPVVQSLGSSALPAGIAPAGGPRIPRTDPTLLASPHLGHVHRHGHDARGPLEPQLLAEINFRPVGVRIDPLAAQVRQRWITCSAICLAMPY